MTTYRQFLESKITVATHSGFSVSESAVHKDASPTSEMQSDGQRIEVVRL